jgi:hypothetical protein
MTTTQLQIRRDSATNLASTTPVVGEIGYDTTNKNLLAGDGARAGGIPHVSYKHDQTQRFHYATAVGGTADAITITLAEPLDAYVAGVAIEFKATASNTGAATINVSSLGVKTLKKMSSGSLADLAAGDISSGGIYRLVYDGTYFQIITLSFDASSIPTSYITAGTAQATTSGNSYEFTSLPSGIKRLTLIMENTDFSSSGGNLLIQIGDSGGYENTGYTGAFFATGISPAAPSSRWEITRPSGTTIKNNIILTLFNISGNKWVAQLCGSCDPSSGTDVSYSGAGTKELSGTLDRIKVESASGNFTGGSINIMYEL